MQNLTEINQRAKHTRKKESRPLINESVTLTEIFQCKSTLIKSNYKLVAEKTSFKIKSEFVIKRKRYSTCPEYSS